MGDYSREHCIFWLKNPDIDPISHLPLMNDKNKFKQLLKACRLHIPIDDINLYDNDMKTIIYPHMGGGAPSDDNDTLEIDKQKTQLDETVPDNIQRMTQRHELMEQYGYYNDEDENEDENEVENEVVGGGHDVECIITQLPIDRNILNIPNQFTVDNLMVLLKDDNFIIQLLRVEKELLLRKQNVYGQLLQNNSTETIELNYNIIIDRIQSLNNDLFDSQVIADKRTQIIKFLNELQNTFINTREFVKQIICQKIVYFASLEQQHRIMNYMIIGQQGTGKRLITQLFANLYQVLGIINTNQITNRITPSNLECLICVDENTKSGEINTFMEQFHNIPVIFIITNNNETAQKIFISNENMRHHIPHTMYLPNYSGNELSEILIQLINKIYQENTLNDEIITYIKTLILSNNILFVRQASDIQVIAEQIAKDFIFVSAINVSYDEDKMRQTFRKYFLNQGQYATFRDNTIHITKINEFLPVFDNILMANLLDRSQLLEFIQQDSFIEDIMKSKNITQHQTHQIIRTSLQQIISKIDMIEGKTRENVRRYLYSQVYLLSKIYVCNSMDYIIISQPCAHTTSVTDAILELLRHLDIDPLSPSIIKQNDITNLHQMTDFATNNIFLLPYSADDIYDLIMGNGLGEQLTDIQKDYIKYLIYLITKQFDFMPCDIIGLYQCINDDILLYDIDNYDMLAINSSFQRSFYNKGLHIEFPPKGAQFHQQGGSITDVFSNVKKIRRNCFN